jgi:hypothetical protein
MLDVVLVAAMVATLLTSGELVPTPRLSVKVVRATVVPDCVKPEVLPPVPSVPQVMLPDVSALRSQLAAFSVFTVNPPALITSPASVDVPVVPPMRVVSNPPANVDVADVDVALKEGASMYVAAEKPVVERSPPVKVEVAVVGETSVPEIERMPPDAMERVVPESKVRVPEV